MDADTSRKICEAVTAKGGRFLEAPVSGSKQPAIGALHPPPSLLAPCSRGADGQLVILAAGDASLYEEAASAFALLGKKSFYLGEAGSGAHMVRACSLFA